MLKMIVFCIVIAYCICFGIWFWCEIRKSIEIPQEYDIFDEASYIDKINIEDDEKEEAEN